MIQKMKLTPSTKRVNLRGSLLKGVAVYRVLYQSILNAKLTGRKNLGRKRYTSNRMNTSLRIQSSKADSNTWESFTRSGLKLESVHQESHAQTSSGKGLPSHFWTRDIVRSILPGLWRKRTVLLPSDPKSSFQMKVNLYFIWKSRSQSLEEEWRGTESCCLKSSVKFPQSVMIWGCHVICWCWSTVFSEVHSQRSHLPRNLRALHASVCLTSFMETLISFSSKTWHLPTLQRYQSW